MCNGKIKIGYISLYLQNYFDLWTYSLLTIPSRTSQRRMTTIKAKLKIIKLKNIILCSGFSRRWISAVSEQHSIRGAFKKHPTLGYKKNQFCIFHKVYLIPFKILPLEVHTLLEVLPLECYGASSSLFS